jgi:phosphate transport system substrate-binding protein
MQEKPQVAAYINFFLTYVNEEIVDVGYFPASTEALETSMQNWLDGMAADVAMTSGDDMEMEDEGMLPMVDPLAVSGDVISAGSSTVFPLAEVMAARFQDEGFAGQITIDSIGSGGGFERFCETGETDVSNASRPIKDSEVEACAELGRTPIEFRVGTDALAVTVSKDNDFITEATLEELALIFSTAETWANVNPEWPDEEIVRYIPGTDSGTFDYFVEEVFDENEEPILVASNLNLSEDDNVLVQGIVGSQYAIGFFGYAYYAENADTLTVLSIEGIEPSAANVDNNSYPLARPLYIYSDATIMQEKPQVAAYINFFLTYVNEEIVDVGYFPASTEALETSMQNWLDGMGN